MTTDQISHDGQIHERLKVTLPRIAQKNIAKYTWVKNYTKTKVARLTLGY